MNLKNEYNIYIILLQKEVITHEIKGVQNSRGEFIAFLDDDDEWLPEKIGITSCKN